MTKRRRQYLTVWDQLARDNPDARIRDARYTNFQPTPSWRWVSQLEFKAIEPWLESRGETIERALPGTFVPDAAPDRKKRKRVRGYLVRCEHLWVTESLDDDWEVAYRIVADGEGEPTLGELRVYPAEPPGRLEDLDAQEPTRHGHGKLVTLTGQWATEFVGFRAQVPRGGLRAQTLRKITARTILKALDNSLRLARQSLAGRGTANDGVMGWLYARMERLASAPPRRTAREAGPGRPPQPDLHYAQLAQQYVTELGKKNRKPVETLAAKRGEGYSRVLSALHRARKRGLLTKPGQRGLAWGELTQTAEDLLKKHRRKRTRRRRKVTRSK